MDDAAVARNILNKHKGYLYGIYVENLAKELSEQVSYNPGIVNLVFVELQNQGYDSNTIIKVARAFLDATNPTVLSYIAKTPDGSILLATVHRTLKCDVPGNAAAARCVKIQIAFAVTTGSPEVKPNHQPNSDTLPRRLSESEMQFYRDYNQTKDVMWNLVKKKWNTNGPRVKFNESVCWELPISGIGFVVYNRDDLKGKRNDRYGYDQIGTKETIDAMIRIAKEWNAIYPNRLLQYGDISRPGGINTPDHGTHMNGKAFDMRPLRNDNQTGNAAKVPSPNSPAYDRNLTKEFIRLVLKLFPGTEFYYNDSEIYRDKEFLRTVSYMAGHDDHLHVMFSGGKE